MTRSAAPRLALLVLATFAGSVHAWPDTRSPWVFDLPKGGSNCTDLGQADIRYDVSFEGDIRSQLQALCNTCHINGSSGGLNMNTTNARANLIGANETGTPAQGNNQRLRVRPFVPTDSVLFEKLNCATPPFGGVMPPSGGDTIVLQRLVHDWIASGALMPDSSGGNRLFVGTFEPIVRPSPAP